MSTVSVKIKLYTMNNILFHTETVITYKQLFNTGTFKMEK